MSDFEHVFAEMQRQRMRVPREATVVAVPNAETILREGLAFFLGKERRKAVWLPEYNAVAAWLSDNKGRGLFLHGDCGRGKSIICNYVLPAILLMQCKKVVSVFDVQQMNRDIDYVLSKHIIALDDIGTEEQSIKYGERRLAFGEIMDAAEKQRKLVIVSTNLSSDEIRYRYGDRILDRIVSTTTRVLFEGKSLRG